MKGLSPKIYDKAFFLDLCLGSDEFKQTRGRRLHPDVLKLLTYLPDVADKKILDVGCGRGDISLFLAKNAKEVIGIDYSKDAIMLANEVKKGFPKKIQKKVKFLKMNAKKLKFVDDYFDVIINIDVFEHLYPNELTKSLTEMSRTLKKDGTLFVHTCTNRILCDYTYKVYILPVNKILTWVDQKLKRVTYLPLPNDPRTKYEKEQHINEPTLFYLKNIFKIHNFKGKITVDIGCLKKGNSIRTRFYNFMVALYPLSKLYPLNVFFGWAFICVMINKKN